MLILPAIDIRGGRGVRLVRVMRRGKIEPNQDLEVLGRRAVLLATPEE